MRISRYSTFILALIAALGLAAQNAAYTADDQRRALEILTKHRGSESGEKLLDIAKEFIGTPYVAGTLERDKEERCRVNLKEVDCTTFVDQVLALHIASNGCCGDFETFTNNLELIRYRGGVCSGYASRLHYISWWIDEMSARGILKEVEGEAFTGRRMLNLNFMSTHPDSYRQLKENPQLIKEIEMQELPYHGREIKYIPKEKLDGSPEALPIKEGDIIAIATTIDGLDVTHVGFAFWQCGKLHLLHASSIAKEVIADPQPLYDYMKNKKSQCGVRVFRIMH